VSGLLNEPGKTFDLDDDTSFDTPVHQHQQLNYSVNQITTLRSSFTEDLNSYVESGIPGIGIWKKKLDECDQDEAIEALRISDLPVSTFSHVGGFTGSSGMDFSDALDEAYESLFLAKALGARAVVVAPGSRGHQFTQSHERRLASEAIRELSYAAEDLSLDLVLQPMRKEFSRRWSFMHSIDDMQRLMDRVNHPRVKMVLDTFQLANEPELLERLGGLTSRIGVVQLSDATLTPASNYDRFLPGCGSLPISKIIDILTTNGYDGFFDIQVWSKKVWNLDPEAVLAECRATMKMLSRINRPATVSESA
jgi:sugar phosphate isomerase/epimerase